MSEDGETLKHDETPKMVEPVVHKKSSFSWIQWLTTLVLGLVTLSGVGLILFLLVMQTPETGGNLQEMRQKLEELAQSSREIQGTLSRLNAELLIKKLDEQSSGDRATLQLLQEQANSLTRGLTNLEAIRASFESVMDNQKLESEHSAKLAHEAKASGKGDLALVYLLNAINGQPGNVELYNQYAAWAVESGDGQTIEGANALLEKALYTVSPDDVVKVTQMLETMTKVPEMPEGEHPPANEPWWAEALKEAERVPLENIMDDDVELGSRIELLSTVLSEIGEGEDPDGMAARLNASLKQAQACLVSTQMTQGISTRFANLEEAHRAFVARQSSETEAGVLSALEAVELGVNQIWNLPLGELPQQKKEAILLIPGTFKAKASEVLSLVEERQLVGAKDTWEWSKGGGGRYANQIKARRAAMENVLAILGGFRSNSGKEKAEQLVREMTEEIGELNKKQFSAYQQWALETIENARKTYYNPAFFSINDNEDARRAIMQTDIRKIDQSLLSPAVNQFFSDVFAQICSEVGAEEVARFQREMAFPGGGIQKRTLEDF